MNSELNQCFEREREKQFEGMTQFAVESIGTQGVGLLTE